MTEKQKRSTVAASLGLPALVAFGWLTHWGAAVALILILWADNAKLTVLRIYSNKTLLYSHQNPNGSTSGSGTTIHVRGTGDSVSYS
jgi:hypothetical protein